MPTLPASALLARRLEVHPIDTPLTRTVTRCHRGKLDVEAWDMLIERVEDDDALIRLWGELLQRVGAQLLDGDDELQHGYSPGRPASHPCRCFPGSPGKVAEMERRAARGEVLFDQRDARVNEDVAKTPTISRGNFKTTGFTLRQERAAG